MSRLVVEIPDVLQKKAAYWAQQDGISLEQFVERAIAAKIEAAEINARFAERARRGNRAGFEAVLAKVAGNIPDPEDEL